MELIDRINIFFSLGENNMAQIKAWNALSVGGCGIYQYTFTVLF